MILVLHLLVDMTVLKVNSKNTEPSQLTFRQAYGQAELRFFFYQAHRSVLNYVLPPGS